MFVMSFEFNRHPFLLSAQDVADQLGTDVDKGLTTSQVETLSVQYPRNELNIGGVISWYTVLIRQLFNAMIIVRDDTPPLASLAETDLSIRCWPSP